ncbi:UNVERIFIED_CONTAM: hypothetical protein Sradi_3006900 [Sesamum radiatum]|uniref:DDE Tnp4 domain-containing protein n=1 Tax=Sesamum radiatum TaxID=300843 RepID=A0AAW2S339_SESRA
MRFLIVRPLFRMRHNRRVLALIALQQIVLEIAVALTIFVNVIRYIKARRGHEVRFRHRRYNLNSRIPDQVRRLYRLVSFRDETYLRNLRMDRNAFGRLFYMLEHLGGVKPTKNVSVPEQVAMFLSVIAHHKRNCVVKHDFIWSGRTVSKHFHAVLHAVCEMHIVLLAKPTPIYDDCTDPRWKWFKDRSAGGPQNKEELFNLKHSCARNVIERTFSLLKVRWAILRSQSFYPIDVQSKIIIACCLLHNFIRNEMPEDPLEMELLDTRDAGGDTVVDSISTIESSHVWSAWRDELASTMYNEWLCRG